jgi:Tfp pilus assembly protein PilV
MDKKGLSLIEILVSCVILALVLTGLVNIFIAGKRYILHSRSRMTASELGRYFLDPLQMQVRQDQWGNNCLSNPASCSNPTIGRDQGLDWTYTAHYYSYQNNPINNLNKVRVDITWSEPAP